jgi:hypothetical protein
MSAYTLEVDPAALTDLIVQVGDARYLTREAAHALADLVEQVLISHQQVRETLLADVARLRAENAALHGRVLLIEAVLHAALAAERLS